MKRHIVTTADGSRTIHIEEWDEHYHSKHGAVQEAYHVFIKNGLALFKGGPLSILEIGFGTGLNAFITLCEAQKSKLDIYYTGVEAYPVTAAELRELDYPKALQSEILQSHFDYMHTCPWEEDCSINGYFKLHKKQTDFLKLSFNALFDLIYFDAFGARVQPELWTTTIFTQMFNALKSKGVLVTYSAKGSVRRAMQDVGFIVERLPGPPGKREMLRAKKP